MDRWWRWCCWGYVLRCTSPECSSCRWPGCSSNLMYFQQHAVEVGHPQRSAWTSCSGLQRYYLDQWVAAVQKRRLYCLFHLHLASSFGFSSCRWILVKSSLNSESCFRGLHLLLSFRPGWSFARLKSWYCRLAVGVDRFWEGFAGISEASCSAYPHWSCC